MGKSYSDIKWTKEEQEFLDTIYRSMVNTGIS